MSFKAKQSLDEKDVEEKLKALRIDYQNISKVIADTTKKEVNSVVNDMESRTTLNPDEAREYGLVHEIRSELFPFGADLSVINEDVSVSNPVPQPVQFQFPFPVQHFTAPSVQSFT